MENMRGLIVVSGAGEELDVTTSLLNSVIREKHFLMMTARQMGPRSRVC